MRSVCTGIRLSRGAADGLDPLPGLRIDTLHRGPDLLRTEDRMGFGRRASATVPRQQRIPRFLSAHPTIRVEHRGNTPLRVSRSSKAEIVMVLQGQGLTYSHMGI